MSLAAARRDIYEIRAYANSRKLFATVASLLSPSQASISIMKRSHVRGGPSSTA